MERVHNKGNETSSQDNFENCFSYSTGIENAVKKDR